MQGMNPEDTNIGMQYADSMKYSVNLGLGKGV